MDISALIAKLRSDAAANRQVILNTSYLSTAQVTKMQGAVGLKATQYVTISHLTAGDIPDANGNSVTITAGQTDLLNQTSLAVKALIFTVVDAETTDVILHLTLPVSWTWINSFPVLTLPPFSLLPVSESCFIYSTAPQPSYQVTANEQIALVSGLNFSGLTNVGKIPKLPVILASQLPSGNIRISGSIDLTGNYAYPVITLLAPLADHISFTDKFNLGSLQLKAEITAPVASVQRINTGLLAADTMFDLLFVLENTSFLTVVVTCQPQSTYAQMTLSQLSSCSLAQALIAGPSWHFENFVPAVLSTMFKSISFEAGLTLTFSGGFKVRDIQFLVYSPPAITFNLGLFTLSAFRLKFHLTDPGGNAAAFVHMQIAAKIPLQTFKSNFTGIINIVSATSNTDTNSTWSIDSITAGYPDYISFNELIHELDTNITISQELMDLTFYDFSLQVHPDGNSYSCACYGDLDMHLFDAKINTQFGLVISHENTKTTYTFNAHTIIGNSSLDMDIQLGGNDLIFTASAQDIPLTELLVSIFSDINIDLTVLPDITLSQITVSYNTPKVGTLSIDGTLDYNGTAGVFHLVGQKTGNTWQFIAMAGFELHPAFDAGAHIPLVGGELTGYLTLKKGYLIITSSSPQNVPMQNIPPDISPGISFYFDVELMGDDTPVTLPILAYSTEFKAIVNSYYLISHDTALNSGNTAHTIAIGKNLGPLFVDSIALSYHNQQIYCAINATMTIGPFNASLDGLAIGTSIDAFSPSFSLNGIGFDFTSAAFTISGALIRIPDSQLDSGVALQFDGALIIRIQQLGLSALGSYAQMTDSTDSFFIFLNANFPPGGPPFFMISGLMGGFGYNRALTLPTFSQLQNFPLLALDAPASGSQKDIAMNTLAMLEGQTPGPGNITTQWVSPHTGDYWVAAGMAFNSFEIINGEVLLTAELGRDMQFALLGLAWLSLPQNAIDSHRLVFVELQMEAVLQPQEGFLGIAAGLTSNSFVLTKDCHLTGGFAFYLWFGDNPHAGQFVVTAGGYHPAFNAPVYYPEVARLGFNWQVSGDVSIKGGSYFAFTPSCAMAGGRLQIQFQSGPLKAWLDAGADFLVTWHPLTFVAGIWVEIGVSLTVKVWFIHKTLSASIGASLDLWGPPIGGIVRIHVVFVTFKIHFGSDSAENRNTDVLAWTEFKQLLPAPADRSAIIANNGLSATLEKDTVTGQIIYNGDTTGNPTTKVWFLRAGRLQFTTKSMIPATMLTYGNNSDQQVNGAQYICIRPMNITTATAVHNLSITKDNAGGDPIPVDGWTFTASYGNVAASLWGQPLTDNGQFVQAPSTPSADTVDQQLTGYTVKGPSPKPGSTFGIVEMRLLLNEYIRQDSPQNPLSTSHPYANDYTPYADSNTLTDIGTIGTGLAAARNAVFTELQQDQLYTGSNDNMLQMGATANSLFVDIPMEQSS
ncbi:DUF6603 domain-containing protein [Chitinophaga solisilvae]|uniref:DUF6603 domain-containing protein n=1 Tax=Chitinophaga solisilvae TaxID=1233460 RepID=UPI001369BE39|nr:DUF6603 domain-containing protein [Chitinophaga solisilvae]